MVTSKSLEKSQNARARNAIRVLINRSFNGNVSKATREFGISQSALATFLAGKTGIGYKSLARIAAWAGITVDALVMGHDRAEGHDRPAIDRAIEKLRDVVTLATIEHLQELSMTNLDPNITVAEWLDEGLAFDRSIRRRPTKK
jgi:transcriptional regulator with XRE-family HTH domain